MEECNCDQSLALQKMLDEQNKYVETLERNVINLNKKLSTLTTTKEKEHGKA